MPRAMLSRPMPAPYSANESGMIGASSHKSRQSDCDERGGGDLRPNRMMITGDDHLNRAGGDLRGSNQRGESHGGSEGESPSLQDSQQMNRQRRRDHRTQRDGCGEQEKHRVPRKLRLCLSVRRRNRHPCRGAGRRGNGLGDDSFFPSLPPAGLLASIALAEISALGSRADLKISPMNGRESSGSGL